MTGLLLVGRETPNARGILETHAERVQNRCAIDTVAVATFSDDPYTELHGPLTGIDDQEIHVVPMCTAHTNETTTELPAALSHVEGSVQYCEPVGYDPAITDAIVDRAVERLSPGPETSLVLAGLGNTGAPHHRQVLEFHAQRLRDRTTYDAVRHCYLVQNPTVECVRYNVPTEQAVVVPLFVLPGPETNEQIPAKLELNRGGLAYADPLGNHEQVTTAIQSRLGSRIALDAEKRPVTFEDALATTSRPVATDGDGRRP